MSSRPVLLLYCQHSLGLGHLTRSWALAEALAADFRVVMVMGGAAPRGLRAPTSVEIVALPPLGQSESGDLVSLDPQYTIEAAKRIRQHEILETFQRVRPSVLVVELFPFGRKKFAFELLPLLEYRRQLCDWHCLVLCSLRDILVSRDDQQAHDERARLIADEHFDTVLVHSDRAIADLADTFRPRTPLRVPVYYTGFVAPNAHRVGQAGHVAGINQAELRNGWRRRQVVVSAGGGRVGEPLFRAAIEAHDVLWPTERLPMTIVAGPFLDHDVWQSLVAEAHARLGLEVVRTVPDLCAELSGAGASVSQCGYNTALDILRARVPALVVPFGDGSEDEQRSRASRLEQLGAVRVLQPQKLNGPRLATEILETLSFEPRAANLDLDGARTTARIIGELLRAGTVRQHQHNIAVTRT